MVLRFAPGVLKTTAEDTTYFCTLVMFIILAILKKSKNGSLIFGPTQLTLYGNIETMFCTEPVIPIMKCTPEDMAILTLRFQSSNNRQATLRLVMIIGS